MKATQRRSRFLIAAAVIGAIAGTEPVFSQPNVPDLSLADAVTLALENHPDARGGRFGIELGESRLAEARSSRLPTLEISETVTRGNNPVFVFGSLLEQARFGPANLQLGALNNPESITNMRTTLAAALPVFDGLRTPARIRQAEIGLRQSELGAASAFDGIRFEIVRRYFGALAALEHVRVAAEGVRMAEAQVERAANLVDAGIGILSDRLGAEVGLADYRQQEAEAEGQVRTAFAELNVATGLPVDARPELSERLTIRDFDVAPITELVDLALEDRNDLGGAESGIDLARERLSEQRGAYLPDVRVFASVDASSPDPASGSADYTVGASIRFTLFDAGRSARTEQARVAVELARVERDRVRDRVQVEVADAVARYDSLARQLELALAARTMAAEALRIVEDRYEVGLGTMTDVLAAGAARVETDRNVTDAAYGLYVAYANVLLVTGQLESVGVFETPDPGTPGGGTP